MEDLYVYATKRARSNYVLHEKLIHKSKTFQFRADFELSRYIENLSKELEQSDSKTIKDILEDFFLERKLKEHAEELEGL